MSINELQQIVAKSAAEYAVPGIAVGIWHQGREIYASHGVTSVANPIPVDEDTIFTLGSTTKSFTATALVILAEQGKVDFDAPVRRYLPELRLADERSAATITVGHLLNHTAGLDTWMLRDTGDGDDALKTYVDHLDELTIIAEPGERASYSQAAFNLLGRVIEVVTGTTYERAIADLLFEPLGIENSTFFAAEAMTRKFSLGHSVTADGTSVAPTWKVHRAQNPGGGGASTARDLVRWARFHLGDGRAESGERIVSHEALQAMRRQTVELRGSSLGDGFGICWFLREIDGAATFAHGGSSVGQFADFLAVPEHDFAIVVLTNAEPGGTPCNLAVIRWALEHYLGLVDRDPEPVSFDRERAAEIVGDYEVDMMVVSIVDEGDHLSLAARIRPELRAASPEMPADCEPAHMGFLYEDGDDYIVTDGPLQGQRGYFARDERGEVVAIDLAGRQFRRVGGGV
ncbi:serine hydrolase domain-containing protein [Glycomyces algeriensis]|uniref:Penicillin-binding protein n=1 Tax=Glycomyces algeriensis TaxID=256037 RepID=A0A9W6G4I9_9ACTN|nr:serine hydrolase domain-containing protein [Glycomyces algeriensis]MDA1367453.1 serine hydrolase [Glycomyces algeriensis]MDR7353185.1 CubicO group peptidase (beta-lactamase class C family) [Glycomyces algeriensis]GLI40879.1 penicillin-binding protein [Glycomyces algeriensis]